MASIEDRPYKWIGRLTIVYLVDDNIYNYIGTAFLIDSKVAVTAAHCLYDKDAKGIVGDRLPDELRFDLGLDGTNSSVLTVDPDTFFPPKLERG